MVWEIGCGHGHFLVRYAELFPAKFCVGVDLILDRLERSGRKRDRARLDNCHFLRAEAREFLLSLPPGITFEEIWVLFPRIHVAQGPAQQKPVVETRIL